MNSVNASTSFSPFQMRFGRLPKVIPPMVSAATEGLEEISATEVIQRINEDVEEAKDNMLQAKTYQAFYANQHRGPERKYAVGDKVMLSTLHCRQQYKKKGEH